ncbi:MAG: hypothetical protein QG653_158 [Patescibacteria group bacterium]|nr:hypothetical protein [Patescibacteria group bacterium]
MNDLSPFLATFGLTETEVASVCAKMTETGITPHKMLHDSSFVEFYIPTANGNRDVRKEISDIIVTVARLADAGGFPNPEPKEFGAETLEEFLGTRRAYLKEKFNK